MALLGFLTYAILDRRILNTKISNLMQISSDTIKDIDVPASGSVMITFTKFKPKSGYNRVVLDHSFNNSSN